MNPPDGSYTLEPEDALAAMSARIGRAWPTVIVLIAVAVTAVNLAAGTARWRLFEPIGIAAVLLAGVLLVPQFAARAVARMRPAQRRMRVTFRADSVTISDEAGTRTRVAWSRIRARRRVDERLFLELPSGMSYVLPRRAWGDDFADVEAFVATRVPEAKTSRFLLFTIVSWIVLIAMYFGVRSCAPPQ